METKKDKNKFVGSEDFIPPENSVSAEHLL